MNQKAIDQTRAIFDKAVTPRGVDRHAACLQWSVILTTVLNESGSRAVLQGGSASFPIITPDQDDGERATHFSYIFEPEVAIRRYCLGKLPEMHCWVGLPDSNEIVDMTAGFQPQQARETAGLQYWNPELYLPEVLWCKCDSLPKGVRYMPDRVATIMAAKMASTFFRS